MMTRRQFLRAGAVPTGTMWAAGAGAASHVPRVSGGAPVFAPSAAQGRRQGRPFVDVHVHMGDQVSGVTQTDFRPISDRARCRP
jgi:hypothetical protein